MDVATVERTEAEHSIPEIALTKFLLESDLRYDRFDAGRYALCFPIGEQLREGRPLIVVCELCGPVLQLTTYLVPAVDREHENEVLRALNEYNGTHRFPKLSLDVENEIHGDMVLVGGDTVTMPMIAMTFGAMLQGAADAATFLEGALPFLIAPSPVMATSAVGGYL